MASQQKAVAAAVAAANKNKELLDKSVIVSSSGKFDLVIYSLYGRLAYLNFVRCKHLTNKRKLSMYKLGWGKITYMFSANANVFPFHFRLTHPPRLLVTR